MTDLIDPKRLTGAMKLDRRRLLELAAAGGAAGLLPIAASKPANAFAYEP